MSARTEELKKELTATLQYAERVGEKLENPDLSQAERADLESELEAVEVKAKGLNLDYERSQKTDERELRIKNIGRENDLLHQAQENDDETVQYKTAMDALFDNDVLKLAASDKTFRESKWDTGSIEFKATDPVDSNPDDLVQHLRPGIQQPFLYPQRVGALFEQATMDGSSVSWIDVPVADGQADYAGYGTQKPGPADIEVDVHLTKAAKIATTYLCPDDALDDLTGLRSTVEAILLKGPNGIGVKAEQEYIAGSGAGTPLQLSGVDSLSPSDVSGNGTQVASDILFAALDIENETGFPATAAVLNPLDYFALLTLEDDQGRPMFTPWGGFYKDPGFPFQIVRSKAVPQGTVYVGAWNASILYTRQAVNVRATREGLGLADKNLTLFVAETRQALIHPYGASVYRTVSIGS